MHLLYHKLFPSLQDNETIYLVTREHWVRLALKIFVWVFFLLVLYFFKSYTPTILPGLFEGNAGKITSLFIKVYQLFLLLSLFLIWAFWYLNIQIITDRRIVDIDQVGLFHHEISELHIENIEDVTSQTSGVLGTVFDYGMVFVQTAGTIERFEFDHVPSPAYIEKLILDRYEKLANRLPEKLHQIKHN